MELTKYSCSRSLSILRGAFLVGFALVLIACLDTREDPNAGAPPPVQVKTEEFSIIRVDRAERFTLVTAVEHVFTSRLSAIGTVVSDTMLGGPMHAIAAGHREDIRTQYSYQFTESHSLRGHVWIDCYVAESDLTSVHTGEAVKIRLSAFPGKVLSGRVHEISPLFGSPMRYAKVRVEALAAAMLRTSTIAVVVFQTYKREVHALIPATAVLHFHRRNWVYVPAGEDEFRRVDIITGRSCSGDMEEVASGIKPGDQVIQNALALQNTIDRQ